ncbi:MULTISPECIES: hypothetical protein [Deinococcus]|uniref:hypothetical protein n=1 Tax=Deinococcus TaxID=1298 RepID=UPI001074A466|nr:MULTISPECIES: hypothetical protein [Deinococcus]
MFQARRQAVRAMLLVAQKRAPELRPELQALLQAEWISRAVLRRLKWRLWRRTVLPPGRLVR